MNPNALTAIQAVVILLLAPLALGLVRALKARFAGRRGPSPFLLYRALAVNMKKENLIPTGSSWVFRASPYVTLANMFLITISLPLVVHGGALNYLSHFLVALGMLYMSTLFLAFGAMDAGSVYGGIGASRHVLLSALALPTLFLGFLALAIVTGETTVDGMMGDGILLFREPFIALVILAFTLIGLAEMARYPVDNPETSLELTMIRESMILQYSGPYLAFHEYAWMLKFIAFELVIMNLIIPAPLITTESTVTDVFLVIVVTLAKIIFAGAFIAFVESVIAKMKFYRMQEYFAGAFFMAAAGLALVLVAHSV